METRRKEADEENCLDMIHKDDEDFGGGGSVLDLRSGDETSARAHMESSMAGLEDYQKLRSAQKSLNSRLLRFLPEGAEGGG